MRSVTVVSIVRFHYLIKGNLTSPDITWNFVDIALWSVLEGNLAIVCGTCTLTTGLVMPLKLGNGSCG